MLGALPEVLQRVQELERICELEQPMFDAAWAAVQKVLDEQFAYSCGEYGLQRWEKLLKIVPRQEADTDERVRAVLFRLNEQLPFTMQKMAQLLDLVAPEGGYELQLKREERELLVKVSLQCKPVERLIREVLERAVPANILWSLYWEYNRQRALVGYTHAELAQKTHYQIREEVFD